MGKRVEGAGSCPGCAGFRGEVSKNGSSEVDRGEDAAGEWLTGGQRGSWGSVESWRGPRFDTGCEKPRMGHSGMRGWVGYTGGLWGRHGLLPGAQMAERQRAAVV